MSWKCWYPRSKVASATWDFQWISGPALHHTNVSQQRINTLLPHHLSESIWIIWLKYFVCMFIKTFNHPSPFDPSPIPPLYQVTLIILDPAFTGTSVPLDSTVGQRLAKPEPRTCRWMGRWMEVEDVTTWLVRFDWLVLLLFLVPNLVVLKFVVGAKMLDGGGLYWGCFVRFIYLLLWIGDSQENHVY